MISENTSNNAPLPNIALSLTHVHSGYEKKTDILQDISLDLPQGALYGLVGLNGAGKSTILSTIMGLLHPHSGSINYFGEDCTTTPPEKRIYEGLYLIPQSSSLFPYLSVRQNLQFISDATGNDWGLALECFPGLEEFLTKKASELSGGWQKILEFGKATIASPKVLLIDEPSIGLSPSFAQNAYEWITHIHKSSDVTILMVDHNINKLLDISQFIYVLSLGKITASGATSDFAGDIRSHIQTWLGLEKDL